MYQFEATLRTLPTNSGRPAPTGTVPGGFAVARDFLGTRDLEESHPIAQSETCASAAFLETPLYLRVILGELAHVCPIRRWFTTLRPQRHCNLAPKNHQINLPVFIFLSILLILHSAVQCTLTRQCRSHHPRDRKYQPTYWALNKWIKRVKDYSFVPVVLNKIIRNKRRRECTPHSVGTYI